MVIIIIVTVIVISIIDVIFLIRIVVIFTIFAIIVIVIIVVVVLCYAVLDGLNEVRTTVLRDIIWQIKIRENPLVYMQTKTDVYFTVE